MCQFSGGAYKRYFDVNVLEGAANENGEAILSFLDIEDLDFMKTASLFTIEELKLALPCHLLHCADLCFKLAAVSQI